jgi:A/G-specific adenine glycosylase
MRFIFQPASSLMPTTTATITNPLTTAWLASARRRLLAWYRKNARDLPWRRTSDPYAVWVSEIMLQQTQVGTVERYYPRFLAAIPTIAALAAAPEDRVLRLWEGLGYYRRARQLHAAAKKIVADHAGQFPRDAELVRRLLGIGRYTAGAILSIAFDAQEPILEANTIRLLSRLTAYRGDPTTVTGQTLLWSTAESLLPRRGSGTLNQALMEVGSLICTPRNPNCGQCPLESLCPTQAADLQDQIPAPKRQPIMEDVHETAVVVRRRDGTVLLRKCADGERWAGLWDFPRFASPMPSGSATKSKRAASNGSVAGANRRNHATILHHSLHAPQIIAEVHRLTGISIANLQPLVQLRHGVTRFRITLSCFTADCANNSSRLTRHSNSRWVRPQDLEKYPLSTTGRKLVQSLPEHARLREK